MLTPSLVTGFFEARRQKKYFQSRSLIMSPWMIRNFFVPAGTAYSKATSVTAFSTNELRRKKSRFPST